MLRCSGARVLGVEDELLDDSVETDLPIVGEGALMAQLSRARDRSMHSIVATIQAEQDKAIRAPGKGVVTISGGPGTGKTVVALHRAAFLLYSDRRRYEGGGVLVVGPSGVFMRYIERVLPSLGETAVALRSLGEVVDGVRATRHDEPAVADLKGSERMAEVMRRTARQQAPGSAAEFRVFWRDDVIHLDRGVLGRLRRQLMSHGQRNRQLPRIATTLLDAMWRQVRGERGRERGREAFEDEMLGRQDFIDFAVAWWPPLTATDVFGWLRDPELLARVSEGVLTDEEQRLLSKSWVTGGELPGRCCRSRTSRSSTSCATRSATCPRVTRTTTSSTTTRVVTCRSSPPPPTASTPPPAARGPRRATGSRTTASPTCWSTRRRTSRRCSGGWSAGAARPPPGRSWATPPSRRGRSPRHRPGPGPPRSTASSCTSSTSRPTTATARRSTPTPRRTPSGSASTPTSRPRCGRPASSRPSSRTSPTSSRPPARRSRRSPAEVAGTVGIVVPVARRSEVNAWLASWPELAAEAPGARAAVDSAVAPSADDRVVVLTGLDTKGLEFDGIVVVRPQEIEDESATGRATLYVVLTRATQLLTTVG